MFTRKAMVIVFCMMMSVSIIGCGAESNTDGTTRDTKKVVETVIADEKGNQFLVYAKKAKSIYDETEKKIEHFNNLQKDNSNQYERTNNDKAYISRQKEIAPIMEEAFTSAETKLKQLGNPPNEQSKRLFNAIIEYNNSRREGFWMFLKDFQNVSENALSITLLNQLRNNANKVKDTVEKNKETVEQLFTEAGL